MAPQVLGPNHERGYYVVWDTVNWRKERVSQEILSFVWNILDISPLTNCSARVDSTLRGSRHQPRYPAAEHSGLVCLVRLLWRGVRRVNGVSDLVNGQKGKHACLVRVCE